MFVYSRTTAPLVINVLCITEVVWPWGWEGEVVLLIHLCFWGEQEIDVKNAEWCLTLGSCSCSLVRIDLWIVVHAGWYQMDYTAILGRRSTMRHRDTTDILHRVLQGAAWDSTSRTSFANIHFCIRKCITNTQGEHQMPFIPEVSLCLQSNNPSSIVLQWIVHLNPPMNNASHLPNQSTRSKPVYLSFITVFLFCNMCLHCAWNTSQVTCCQGTFTNFCEQMAPIRLLQHQITLQYFAGT